MTWLADDMVTAVRRRARIPDGAAALSDAEIFSLADEEMLSAMVPLVRKQRQDYWLTSEDASVVANQAGYRIPSRAQAATVRDVTFVDGNGNECALPRISTEQYHAYVDGASRYWPNRIAYAMLGDKVTLCPTPTTSTGSVRFRYHCRPNRLVTASDAFLVSDISGAPTYKGTGPSTWSAADLVDAIQATPNFDWLTKSVTVGTTTSSTILVAVAGGVTGMAVGDYFAQEGESPVVQLPDIMHPVLIAGVTVRVLETLGDLRAMELAQAKYQEIVAAIQEVIEERDEGDQPKVLSWNTPLRVGRRRRR